MKASLIYMLNLLDYWSICGFLLMASKIQSLIIDNTTGQAQAAESRMSWLQETSHGETD